jgi:RNA polymerase-binding protein DksA
MAAVSSRDGVPVKKAAPATVKKAAPHATTAHPAAPHSAAKASPAKSSPAKSSPAKSVAPAKPVAPAKATAPANAQAVDKPAGAARPVKKAAATAPAPATGSSELHWTPAELTSVRRGLIAELAEMQSEYDRSMDELNELHQTGTDGAGDDQADAGSKTFEREQELSIAANRLDLLNQIQRAIERVDAGTYGLCESCGNPIPKARLKAFPMATLDVGCKQREERR